MNEAELISLVEELDQVIQDQVESTKELHSINERRRIVWDKINNLPHEQKDEVLRNWYDKYIASHSEERKQNE